jgi:hypothetical protein
VVVSTKNGVQLFPVEHAPVIRIFRPALAFGMEFGRLRQARAETIGHRRNARLAEILVLNQPAGPAAQSDDAHLDAIVRAQHRAARHVRKSHRRGHRVSQEITPVQESAPPGITITGTGLKS